MIKSIPRLTYTGAQLLARMKRDIQERPEEMARHNGDINSRSQENGPALDHALVWSAALLGTGVLAATPFAEYDTFLRSEMRKHSASGAAGGCGGTGCAGDGGGGCGGGCGGCGG